MGRLRAWFAHQWLAVERNIEQIRPDLVEAFDPMPAIDIPPPADLRAPGVLRGGFEFVSSTSLAGPVPRTIARYGWRKDHPDIRDRRSTIEVQRVVKLPATKDLSTRPAMPAPYDQTVVGSCTGNAIARAFEYDLRDQGLPSFTPSRLAIYYDERVIEHTTGSDSGAEIRDGMKVIATIGAGPETLWPYDVTKVTTKPSPEYYAAAAAHRSAVYERVAQTEEAIKSVLAAGRPIVFGISVYDSFESAAVAKTGRVPMPKEKEQLVGGHAIVMTGYTKTTFRFCNSWGVGWGKRGYGSLPIDYVLNPDLCSDLWTVRTVT